jgi:hypothetical protein
MRAKAASIAGISFLFLLGMPAALGSNPGGSEEQPELRDQANDVSYHTAHLGSKDHGYIDMRAGWFSYDPASDNVNLTIQLADVSKLMDAKEWQVQYKWTVNGTKEQKVVGAFWFQADKIPPYDLLRGQLAWYSAGQSSPVILDKVVAFRLVAPDRLSFLIDKDELLKFADSLDDLSGMSFETPRPAGYGFLPFQNRDDAASKSSFDLRPLRPAPPAPEIRTNHQPEPPATVNDQETSPPQGQGTPIPAVLGFGAVAIATIWIARRKA